MASIEAADSLEESEKKTVEEAVRLLRSVTSRSKETSGGSTGPPSFPGQSVIDRGECYSYTVYVISVPNIPYMRMFMYAEAADLQEKAVKALKSLQNIKKEIAHEHRHNFASYSNKKGKRPRLECSSAHAPKRNKTHTSWTHCFTCLANCNQLKVPTAGWEREMLLDAGLAEKKIFFPIIDCCADEYRKTLCDAFPKILESGGFELMRCCPNSRNLECCAPSALQSPRATQERVGRSKVYIRPIQKDLDVTPIDVECSATNTIRNIFKAMVQSKHSFVQGSKV